MNVVDMHAYRYIYLSFLKKYLFIWLVGQVLTVAHRLFLAPAGRFGREGLSSVAYRLQSVWVPAVAEQGL